MKKQEKEKIYKNGIIMKVQNKLAEVLMDGETIVSCNLPKTIISDRNAVVVGDHISMEQINNEQYKLIEVSHRTNLLSRGNRHITGESIAIAANVDYILAVVTADYIINQTGYWEQAMIAAKRAGLSIGLVVTKWDLVNETAHTIITKKLLAYNQVIDTIYLCEKGNLPEQLKGIISNKITVVVGERSCGKTSLIEQLLGINKKQSISTNTIALIKGNEQTMMIDTPGFKDFALEEITDEERAFVFPEIEKEAQCCTYRNCSHTHEEGCQVIEGVRSQRILRERYHVYQQMSGNSTSMAKKRKYKEIDYRHNACMETFECKVCGKMIIPEGAGSAHRNHCPYCLSSIHVDETPGDRASLCKGIMDAVGIWVRKGGEWAIIHRCRECGKFSSNRVAADDNQFKLMSIAVKPLSSPPFPLDQLEQANNTQG